MSGILAEYTQRRFIPLHKARKYFVNSKIKLDDEIPWLFCDFYKIKYYEGKAYREFCDRQAKYQVVLLEGGIGYRILVCSFHARYFRSRNNV